MVKSEMEYCKQKHISVITKKTNMKHIKHISFLNEPCIKYANNDLYTQEIHHNTNIEQGVIEIRKETVYKKGYKLKALVIYTTLNKANNADEQLIEASFRNGKHMKYISFKGITQEDRICCLYTNSYKNIQAK